MDRGIPQECRGGVWVRTFEDHTPVSLVVPGLPTETSPTVACFLICGIMAFLVVIITACLWCASTMAKPSSKPAVMSAPAPPPTSTHDCSACGAARRPGADFCVACGAHVRRCQLVEEA